MASKQSSWRNKMFKWMTALSLVIGMVGAVQVQEASAADPYLLSQNRPVYVSSNNGGVSGPLAVDGDPITRWESAQGQDPQWVYVDLGATASITHVTINWESAYSKNFQIQVSNDEYTWTPIYTNTNFGGGTTDVNVTGTGRYVRMYSVERALTGYGVSIYEFKVFGTGGYNQPPKPPVVSVALNKPVTASSEQNQDPNFAGLPAKDYAKAGLTDGDRGTRWSSLQTDAEWVYVDLGQTTQIGKVVLRWEAAFGRAYDIQVSNNATTWTTVYRQLHGSGGTDEIPLYASGRYVRMNGYGRGSGYGYSLWEMEVYPYQSGDPQPSYSIPTIPAVSTVNVGSGSYEINDITQLEAVYPKNKTANVTGPIPSNDWWQNLLIAHLGNSTGIITLPLKNKYTENGLGLMNPGAGYINGDGGAVNADGEPDMYLMANNMPNTSAIETKVDGYGDYSVNVIMSDDATAKMKTTFVKGSPYVYNTFADPDSPEIYSLGITKIFDDANNSMLTTDGSSVTTDHIGVQITNTDNAATPHTFVRSYAVVAPPGTVFTKAGNKIKMKLGSSQNYLSIATIPSNGDLNYYYQHGYAFVTNTQVSYNYDVSQESVTTNFNSVTQLKRSGFSADTLMAMLPHQWKVSNSSTSGRTYASIRGLLKVHEGNTFTTADKFNGIIPQMVEPNDSSYSQAALKSYLTYLDTELANTGGLMNQDPYWQGKVLHPTAMAALIADQLGDYTRRDNYLNVLRTVLTNWYTYSANDALHTFYFHYSPDWGSIYPWAAGWGINTGITDHHYTYGYFAYASAVLAAYDSNFKNNYGGMVEQLIRDYANPSRTDSMYPWMRSFDPYEGHSWAGGYADNNSGNNQEAAGESLDGYAGAYLWGVVTGNNAIRDAAAWVFTTELKSIEQYWFNYDHDNWIPEYQHGVAGQVWGSAYVFGTYFSGAPVNIYGIHWLPTAEWMTYFGKNPQKAADLYAAFLQDNGGPEVGWEHIIWSFEALSDPQAVINKWNPSIMQLNEVFNTYWFVHNAASYGNRTTDIWADNWSSVGVYKKGNQYTAHIWNPTDAAITVQFRNASGVTGSATVAAHSLVKVNPLVNGGGDTQAPSAPGGLTATTASSSQIDLAWNASTDNIGVAGYDIYRNGAKVGSSIGTTFSDTGLSPLTAYSYTVKARDIAGNASAASNTASATTLGVYTALSRTGWTATSNPTSGDAPGNMLDGNTATRWSSGTAMVNGQSFTVDMKATKTFNRVVLDAASDDYARGYQVFVSGDGTNWGSAVASGTGNTQAITVDFAVQNARYIKVVQTGTSPNWWSVAEFNVYYNGTPGGGDTQAPSTPTGLTATATSSSQINLSWTASTDNVGVTGYDVYRGGALVGSSATTSYSDTGLTASTAYSYTVKAKDAAGNVSAASAAASATTQAGGGTYTALSRTGWTATSNPTSGDVPANLLDGVMTTRWSTGAAMTNGQYLVVDMKAAQSFNRIVMDSTNAANDYARGYQVYVSNDGTNWGSAVATGTGNAAVITVDFAAQSARYIKVLQTGTSSSWWSINEFNVYSNGGGGGGGSDTQAPSAPTGLTATATSSSQINLSWTASTDNVGVTGYDVYRGGTLVGSTASTTYSDTGLSASTAYSYTVKAKDSAGNVSAASAAASATTQAGGGGGTYTALSRTGWTASSNPTSGDVPANLLDGVMTTRWSTGAAMTNGQYLVVDMQAAQSFRRIVMDSTNAAGDYARGYQVFVSNDGTNWGSAVASGTGSTPVITVDFATQSARYIKVVQTGSASSWWSINELNVYQ